MVPLDQSADQERIKKYSIRATRRYMASNFRALQLQTGSLCPAPALIREERTICECFSDRDLRKDYVDYLMAGLHTICSGIRHTNRATEFGHHYGVVRA